MIRIESNSFTPAEELENYRRHNADAGAIASFTGYVRPKADMQDVTSLYLEHAAGLTEKSIAEFSNRAQQRWNIDPPLIIHRIGTILAGEPIVLVATSAAHRRDAIAGVDFLMDYLKTRAFFWKKEKRSGEDVWIEPRQQDYLDADRWS
ncbi:MAG: molybdenum cofactor biosynthesis protein MoaE [bacterium]